MYVCNAQIHTYIVRVLYVVITSYIVRMCHKQTLCISVYVFVYVFVYVLCYIMGTFVNWVYII